MATILTYGNTRYGQLVWQSLNIPDNVRVFNCDDKKVWAEEIDALPLADRLPEDNLYLILGEKSLSFFGLGTLDIRTTRGKVTRGETGKYFIIADHPNTVVASAKRGVNLFTDLQADVALFLECKEALEKNTLKEEDNNFVYRLIEAEGEYDRLLEKLTRCSEVTLDLETTGLDFLRDRITLIGLSIEPGKIYLIRPSFFRDDLGETLSRLNLKGQNIKFDIKFLNRLFKRRFVFVHDTRLTAWALNENTTSKKLTDLARRTGKFFYDWKEVTEGDTWDWQNPDYSTLAPYAAKDVYATDVVIREQLKELEHPDRTATKNFLPFLTACGNLAVKMEVEGLPLDTGYQQALRGPLEFAVSTYKGLFAAACKLRVSEVNINHGPSVAKILFERLKIPAVYGTDTQEGTLREIQAHFPHPAIDALLYYRESFKVLSTYVLGKYFKMHPVTGRIHYNLDVVGTVTGRPSASQPNMLNLPRLDTLPKFSDIGYDGYWPEEYPKVIDIRRMFKAPEGYQWVGADASQIELRLLAALSSDSAMLAAFKEGRDLHLETALRIFGEEKVRYNRDVLRNVGKVVNFNTVYAGFKPLALVPFFKKAGIIAGEQEISSYVSRFKAAYPGLVRLFSAVGDLVLEKQEITGYAGNTRRFGWVHKDINFTEVNKQAVNFLPQNGANYISWLAMLEIDRWKTEEGLTFSMPVMVYDAIYCIAPEHEVTQVAYKLIDSIEKAGERVVGNIVPIKSKVKIGKTWGDVS